MRRSRERPRPGPLLEPQALLRYLSQMGSHSVLQRAAAGHSWRGDQPRKCGRRAAQYCLGVAAPIQNHQMRVRVLLALLQVFKFCHNHALVCRPNESSEVLNDFLVLRVWSLAS